MPYFAILTGLILILATIASAETYVVKPDGTGDFPTIQEALDAAVDGDLIELTNGWFEGEGNHDLLFHGNDVTLRSQSGIPDSCIIFASEGPFYGYRGIDFCGEGPNCVVEGVEIKGGGIDSGCGAGIRCTDASPTIRNCILLSNSAEVGGGMAILGESSPTIVDCIFLRNAGFVMAGGLMIGRCVVTLLRCVFEDNCADRSGALYICNDASVTLIDCDFLENNCSGATATGGVGGIGESQVHFVRCRFLDNYIDGSLDAMGGAIHCYHSSITFSDCLFAGNSLSGFIYERGGAVYTSGASVSLLRCTLVGNSADEGAAIYSTDAATTLIDHTIIAFNERGEGVRCADDFSTVELSCCDVFGNDGGDWIDCIEHQLFARGNIWEDPLFCDPAGADLRLHSDSPCAWENNPGCGYIGALPVGCGETVSVPPDNAEPALLMCHPNPFRTSTRIDYSISNMKDTAPVVLSIHDAAGRLDRTLIDFDQAVGGHGALWNGTDEIGDAVVGGVYFYRLSMGGKTMTGRMLLVR